MTGVYCSYIQKKSHSQNLNLFRIGSSLRFLHWRIYNKKYFKQLNDYILFEQGNLSSS